MNWKIALPGGGQTGKNKGLSNRKWHQYREDGCASGNCIAGANMTHTSGLHFEWNDGLTDCE
ncbi:MAG: hypothetical protein GY722_26025 [bacterium]|nr:hypothetical protein [bacterium]